MSTEDRRQILPTPSDFGSYYVEKALGHGGMGDVYLATDTMLDRQVALKVMLKGYSEDPDFVRRFQREAQAAARLNNPYIVQVYAFGKEDGLPYIAMELVGGGSLGKELKEAPDGLDPMHVMRVGWQVAQGLDCAAEHQLLHGDLKPDNILYDENRRAKLADFGLAAMQGNANEIWGTPNYVSPEILRRQHADHRADQYSFGCTLYHALTGHPPFEGPNAIEVLRARFRGLPPPPSAIRPGIPAEIDAIVMRMIQRDPTMRYPSFEPVIADLKDYLRRAIAEKKRAMAEQERLEAERARQSRGVVRLGAGTTQKIPAPKPAGVVRLTATPKIQAPAPQKAGVIRLAATQRIQPAPVAPAAPAAPQPLKLMRLKPTMPGTPNKVFTFRPVAREGGGPAQAVS